MTVFTQWHEKYKRDCTIHQCKCKHQQNTLTQSEYLHFNFHSQLEESLTLNFTFAFASSNVLMIFQNLFLAELIYSAYILQFDATFYSEY